jgi:hypothetical protein
MSRLKAIYRSWGIPCAGQQVYAPRYRAEWLAKISEAGVRRRAELLAYDGSSMKQIDAAGILDMAMLMRASIALLLCIKRRKVSSSTYRINTLDGVASTV